MVSNIEPIDQIKDKEGDVNLYVPIGHYAISSNVNNPANHSPNFSIYGLGSCIALILFDDKNSVSAMSHILLPKVNTDKKILYPHKYANLSVKLLLDALIYHGAVRKNIKAIIVGGSKIFNFDINFMGIDNTTSVKEELRKLKIQIIKEDTGGSIGRNVIFDTKCFSLSVRLTSDPDFTRID
ncbi:MAG: chemotaxis protein CheD [Promethearchaeota archaeon]|jgi:chemotaxis protein CheD